MHRELDRHETRLVRFIGDAAAEGFVDDKEANGMLFAAEESGTGLAPRVWRGPTPPWA